MQNKPMTSLIRISSLAFFLAMGGCAVMDKSDCANANWQALGQIDASNGQYIFPAREKSCSEHGLSADKASYDLGIQTGLIGFCTAASGRYHGQNGGAYNRGFCPADTESAFLSGYTPARQKFEFQQKVSTLQSQIATQSELLRKESSKTYKNSNEIERLNAEIKRLKEELRTQMYMRILD